MPFPGFLKIINKHVTNKLILLFAGRIKPFAVLHHTGRRSGREYVTPLLAFPSETGFVFALTYGRDVDWAKNLVAGGGELVFGGDGYSLGDACFVDYKEVRHVFPLFIRWVFQLISVDSCLTVEEVDSD